MAHLDKLALTTTLNREYYGWGAEKPNEYCHWSQSLGDLGGWYETDKHFRRRIEDHFSKKAGLGNV